MDKALKAITTSKAATEQHGHLEGDAGERRKNGLVCVCVCVLSVCAPCRARVAFSLWDVCAKQIATREIAKELEKARDCLLVKD